METECEHPVAAAPDDGWRTGWSPAPDSDVWAGTLTPLAGTTRFYSDAALRDPADPARLDPAYDSGDHLHPNEMGYRVMAQQVDLRLLNR